MKGETRWQETIKLRSSEPVLGINLSHDMSCAAVVDGEVVVAIEEERLVRIKHCDGKTHLGQMIPFASIRYCLAVLGTEARDIGLWIANATSPGADRVLRERLIGIDPDRIREVPFPGHHMAHAASAFFPSPFLKAAVLVVDVNGSSNGIEKENYSIYQGDGESLELIDQTFVRRGEVGIGDLYTIYAAILRLSPVNDGPYGADDAHSSGGKLMGYAAYGHRADKDDRARRSFVFAKLIEPLGDRFVVENARLVDHLLKSGRVEKIVAEERLSEVFGSSIQHCVQWRYRSDSLECSTNIAFAQEGQALLEDTLLRMVERTHTLTGCTDLCLAGGSTLNTTAARRILMDTPMRRLFIQPAANDAGTAIGAAFYGYHRSAASPRRAYLERRYSTLLGKSYSAAEIDAALALPLSVEIAVERLTAEDDQIAALVGALRRGKIVALFRGRSEFGPRALGSRSLLAAPSHSAMLKRMNDLKGREWYRPVAPIVPSGELDRWFDAPFTESPFMTINAQCRPETLQLAPAVCHVDGSARVQTVTRRKNPFLHDLLWRFAENCGRPPILINTSFNLREPIVETPRDALRTFLEAKGQIDALLLEDRLVTLAGSPRDGSADAP